MSSLIKIYTDNAIVIAKIKAKLYSHGISSITKNEFQAGAAAGFSAGMPAFLDLYIDSDQKDKAITLIEEILDQQDQETES